MFKKILASFGKGAAVVDLRLQNTEYKVGENVQGNVIVQGGDIEQKVNSINVGLFMEIQSENGPSVQHIDTIPLSGSFVIGTKEEKVFPFLYQLPYTLPVSSSTVSFYYDTHLDIEGGIDKKDVDYIQVTPKKELMYVFQTLESLGFRQKTNSGKLDHYGQEFVFFPTTHFNHEVNEVEIRFAYEEHGIRIWMEVDVRQDFHEAEVKRELFLNEETLNNESELTELLEQVIAESIHHPQQYHEEHGYSSYGNHHELQEQYNHHSSSVAGMVGSFAAGAVGGMLLNETIEEFTEDDDNAEENNEFSFGDFFGGEEEED